MGKIERRAAKRLPVLCEVTYSDGQRSFTDFVRDISTGGIQIESPVPFTPGTHLTLTLTTPLVKLRGLVCWCRKDGIKYAVGVKFLFEDPEQQGKIRELLSSMFWKYAKA